MGQVKLILRESVPSLGEAGDLVSVKPGYARNYLIPQGKAIFATESNVQEFEHHKRVVAGKVAKELKELGAVKARIESLSLEVKARVGEEGKLFGSVTALQIAGAPWRGGSRSTGAGSSSPSPSSRRGSTALP